MIKNPNIILEKCIDYILMFQPNTTYETSKLIDIIDYAVTIFQQNSDYKKANFARSIYYCLVLLNCFELTFLSLDKKEYLQAWNHLNEAINRYGILKKNVPQHLSTFNINFLVNKLVEVKSLFPYIYFVSPEIIEKSKCSICGKERTPFSTCDHELGKIYKGDLCYACVDDGKFLGVALTTEPVQYFSMIQQDFDFNYSLLDVFSKVVKNAKSWKIESEADYIPFWELKCKKILPNSNCPCGSHLKFEDCCMRKIGIRGRKYKFSYFDDKIRNTKVILLTVFPDKEYLKEIYKEKT